MILVTGGFGFIGTHTVRALLDAGEDCVVARRSDRPVPESLRPELGSRLQVDHVDFDDADALLAVGRRYPITGIVHLADPAIGHLVDSSGPGAPLRFSQLLVGLGNIIDASIRWQVARTTIVSTIGVYAGAGNGPWNEDMPLPLVSSHGIPAMKKIAETLGGFAVAQSGMPAVFVRPSLIWGPGARPSSFVSPLPELAHAAANGLHEASLGGRDYFADDEVDICYVKDCAKAIALIHLATDLQHTTYNIGGGRGTSNTEIVESIRRSTPDFTAKLSDGRSAGAPEAPFLDLTRLRLPTRLHPRHRDGRIPPLAPQRPRTMTPNTTARYRSAHR
jgi:UDP-glucose 4-epimerase